MTTTTSTTTSDYMHSSISSLTSSQQQPLSVARTYKQASQLFLTRRTSEALEVLEPIIRRPDSSDADANSDSAPVASASRGARLKVWSLYVSILNAVVEMGSEEGTPVFGKEKWKELVTKARDGTVWEEVVRDGYGGMEGSVDAEVVANLATLLLAQAPSQQLTQQRLEAYLSAASTPDMDMFAITPSIGRDIQSRLKVLEIYILHVLPQNEEWDYAQEFLKMNDLLDEDRKESYVQTLQTLQEQGKHDAEHKQELQRRREKELEDDKRREEEERTAYDVKVKEEYEREQEQKRAQADARIKASGPDARKKQLDTTPRAKAETRPKETPTPSNASPDMKGSSLQRPRPSGPTKKSKSPPPSLYRRASLSLVAIQQNLMHMGRGLSRNPMTLLRTVLFLVALLTALARRDVRDRLNQARDSAWEKLRRTVGMGVKVSYI